MKMFPWLALAAALLSAAPARATDWEAELAAGLGSSNVRSTAGAFQARAGISVLPFATVSLRAVDFAGNAARDGRAKAFSGWLALGELRLHTGHALGPARLHLALAAGVGREIVASPGPFADRDPGPVETGRAGPSFLVSTGGALRTGPVALSLDLAACYWTRFAPSPGANGGLGAALLFGIGVLP
ncbi:MAG: hypothetical protein NVSMB23_08700 [Myxococcales bacterium]